MEKNRGFTNQKARFDSWIRLHVEVSFDTPSTIYYVPWLFVQLVTVTDYVKKGNINRENVKPFLR